MDAFNYVADGQMSLFDFFSSDEKQPIFKIEKPVRIIEMFAGYGSQAMGLKRLGVDFEHYKISEWCISSVNLYKAAHFPNVEVESNLSKEEAIDVLLKYGVSQDGKEPLTRENLSRKSVEWLNDVIAKFKATNNIGSIVNVHASDLEIVEREKYEYVFCYSFPCQDISVAGLGKGFSKDNQQNEEKRTRSGLLWECERILDECGTELPQVLLMENVKNLLSKSRKREKDENGNIIELPSNYENFVKWCEYLESKGYSNFYKVMDASKFGVPQHRERVFMVSILGAYKYEFPEEIPLKKRMKDYLEDEVDKKYYITSDRAKTLIDKLILDGKILTNERTNERTNLY